MQTGRDEDSTMTQTTQHTPGQAMTLQKMTITQRVYGYTTGIDHPNAYVQISLPAIPFLARSETQHERPASPMPFYLAGTPRSIPDTPDRPEVARIDEDAYAAKLAASIAPPPPRLPPIGEYVDLRDDEYSRAIEVYMNDGRVRTLEEIAARLQITTHRAGSILQNLPGIKRVEIKRYSCWEKRK